MKREGATQYSSIEAARRAYSRTKRGKVSQVPASSAAEPEAGQSWFVDVPRKPSSEHSHKLKISKCLEECPKGFDATKLSLVEKYITEVDLLPDRFRAVEVIYLSNNSISRLHNFKQFANIRVLSLANNCVSDVEELEHLMSLKNLQIVSFEFNPISHLPYYRAQVVARIPHIRMLDSKVVQPEERRKAQAVVQALKTKTELMFANELLIQKLEKGIQRVKLHRELRAVVFGRIGIFNRNDLPSFTPFDTSIFLRVCDYSEALTPFDRRNVDKKVLDQLRKAKNIRLLSDRGGRPPKLEDIAPDDMKSSGRRVYSSTPADLWDMACSDVMMKQQQQISNHLSLLEEENVLSSNMRNKFSMHDVGGTVVNLRDEQDEASRMLRTEREDLIREFRSAVEDMQKGEVRASRSNDNEEYQERINTLQERLDIIQAHNKLSISRLHDSLRSPEEPRDFPIPEEEITEVEPEQVSERPMMTDNTRKVATGKQSQRRVEMASPDSHPRHPGSLPIPMTMQELAGASRREARRQGSIPGKPARRVQREERVNARKERPETEVTQSMTFDEEAASALKRQVEMLQAEIEKRVEVEARMQGINEKLRDHLDAYKQQNFENSEKAESELERMQKELNEAMSSREQMLEQLSTTMRERKRLEDLLGSTRHELSSKGEDYSNRIQALEDGLTGKERVVVDMHSKNVETETFLQQSRNEVAKLRNDLEEVAKKYQQVAEERDYVQGKADEYYSELKGELESEEREEAANELANAKVLERMFAKMKRMAKVMRIARSKQSLADSFYGNNMTAHSFLHWRRTVYRTKICREAVAARSLISVQRCFCGWVRYVVLEKTIEAIERKRVINSSISILGIWKRFVAMKKYVRAKESLADSFRGRYLKGTCFEAWFGYCQRHVPSEEEERVYSVAALQLRARLLIWSGFSRWRRWLVQIRYPEKEQSAGAMVHYLSVLGRKFFARWKQSFEKAKTKRDLGIILTLSHNATVMRKSFSVWLSRARTKQKENVAMHMAVLTHANSLLQRWKSYVSERSEKRAKRSIALANLRRLRIRGALRTWKLFVGKRRVYQLNTLNAMEKYFGNLQRKSFRVMIEVMKRTKEEKRLLEIQILERKASVFKTWRNFISYTQNIRKAAEECASISVRSEARFVRGTFEFWQYRTRHRLRVKDVIEGIQRRRALYLQRGALNMWIRFVFSSLKSSLREAHAGWKDVQERLDDASDSGEKAELEKLHLIDEMQRIGSERANLQRRIEEMELELGDANSALQDQIILAKSVRGELEGMKVKNAGLESQLKSLERDVDEQTNEATVSTVQQTYELQRSEERIVQLEEELHQMRLLLEETNNELEKKDEEFRQIEEEKQEEMREAREALEHTREMVEARDQEIADLRTARDQSEVALTGAQGRLEGAQQDLFSRLNDAEERNASLEESLLKLQHELGDVSQRAQQYASELERKDAEIRRLDYEVKLLSERETQKTDGFLAHLGLKSTHDDVERPELDGKYQMESSSLQRTQVVPRGLQQQELERQTQFDVSFSPALKDQRTRSVAPKSATVGVGSRVTTTSSRRPAKEMDKVESLKQRIRQQLFQSDSYFKGRQLSGSRRVEPLPDVTEPRDESDEM